MVAFLKNLVQRVKDYFAGEEPDEYTQAVIQRCWETGKPVVATVNERGELEFKE